MAIEAPEAADDRGSWARAPRWSSRRLPWRHLPLVVLLAGYLSARVRILTGYTLFTAPDTRSYAPRPGEVPIDTLSFTGHAPRPWGVPLLYALVGSDSARVALQWTISTLAWCLLAGACWARLRSLPARILAVTALLCLALSRSVYSWDHALLSESLSISLGIAALALLTIWVTTRSRVALGALALVAFWWTFTRQDVLPYLLLLVVVLAGHAVLRRYRWHALLATVVLLGALGWQAAIVPVVDHSYRSWGSGLSLSEATFVYRLRFQVLNNPQVKAAYQEEFGMPGCAGAEQVAAGSTWSMGPFIEAYRDCPALRAWAAREQGSVGYRYARAHPSEYTEQVLSVLPISLAGTEGRYAAAVPGVPAVPEKLFFPDRHRVLPQASLVFLMALGVGLLARAFKRARWLAAAGAVVALASTASAVAGMMYSAGEYTRFGIQEAVLLRVGLVILAAATVEAVLAWLADRVAALRRRGHATATAAPATTDRPPTDGDPGEAGDAPTGSGPLPGDGDRQPVGADGGPASGDPEGIRTAAHPLQTI
ncbi:hypothetical protein ONA91_27040 [Micromonospora sp. DR5-3]|uniref:hypothetical protein n=1 Tax=unclassified Micromonospora TaxID=2617518 RepID=UPI0011D906B9|nr:MULTISPECIES: hypothetical protein [unclassified Micromonospora]MCW3818110.1 hypothetical protein [Micromonospora sp. DR5-3]TYC22286.1 hypothetical protein FXF52_21355 [Micromonospora sp. MP36]